jgi:ADP-ribose pyrophosphatase YjhB (NUDIX family)
MLTAGELSFVQLKILSKFIRGGELSYSEAKPDGVENDLYKYHLNFLIEKAILVKSEKKYALTEYGKYLVQTLDVFGIPKGMFKVSVIPYVVRTENGVQQLLMHKRLRHPYFGDVETVSGKVLPGESVEDAANRKLKEETGVEAECKFIGVVRKIRTSTKEELFEDTLYHVCLGTNPKGTLLPKTEFGENYWVDFPQAYQAVKNNVTYGEYTEKTLHRVEDGNTELFYWVERLQLKRV